MTATARADKLDKKTRLSGRERRRHRRLDIVLVGRFLSEAGTEHACRTINLSCSGALMTSAEPPAVGSKIVCYFSTIGRFPCEVVRRTAEGFAVVFTMSAIKRDKLADRLTWILNKDKLGLEDERQEARYSAGGPAILRLDDGRALECLVTDISLSGAGFETKGAPPMVGEMVTVGNLRGEVVRRSDRSFGIRFVVKRDKADAQFLKRREAS